MLALAGVVALGLVSRRFPLGAPLYDKSLGDALYAAAVYLTLALLLPRRPPLWLGMIAFSLCFAIECFQLTGIPAAYVRVPPVRWLLGTRFAWHDVLFYAVGILLVGLVDTATRRAP